MVPLTASYLSNAPKTVVRECMERVCRLCSLPKEGLIRALTSKTIEVGPRREKTTIKLKDHQVHIHYFVLFGVSIFLHVYDVRDALENLSYTSLIVNGN